MADDTHALGTCCACGGSKDVLIIMTLPYRAPAPGTGWGCVVCDLPADGAIAVVCTDCESEARPIAFVCGPGPGERVLVETMTLVPFGHDVRKHREIVLQ